MIIGVPKEIIALCNVTLPCAMKIAARGLEHAARELPPVAAVNICRGQITNRAVAEAFGLPCQPLFSEDQ